MKKLLIAGLAITLVLALFVGVAVTAPPDQTADVEVTANVAQSVWLSLDKHAINWDVDPDLNPSDTDSLTATVRSNWNWQLQVSALKMQGANPDGVTETLPNGMISINTLDGNGGTLGSGERTRGTDVSVNYTLDVDWSVAPAIYTDTQTYTLTFR
jgi:hypothetical protein